MESVPLDEELPHADADSASALTRKSAINFFFIKMNLLFLKTDITGRDSTGKCPYISACDTSMLLPKQKQSKVNSAGSSSG